MDSYKRYIEILPNLHQKKMKKAEKNKLLNTNRQRATNNYNKEIENYENACNQLKKLSPAEKSRMLNNYLYQDNDMRLQEIYSKLEDFYNNLVQKEDEHFLVCGDPSKCGVKYDKKNGGVIYIGDTSTSNKTLKERFASQREAISLCIIFLLY